MSVQGQHASSTDLHTSLNAARDVLEVVNADHGTAYELLAAFGTGEWGAYRLAQPGGEPAVLKFFLDLQDTNVTDPDPHLAPRITDHLRPLGYPTPKYLHTGWLNDEGLYWVMEQLPGAPLWRNPTVGQVEKLVSLLRLQRDRAVSEKQNLSVFVKDVVFSGRYGKAQKLKTYSSDTRELLHQAMRSVRGLRNLSLPDEHIVHGDFSYHQAMVEDGRITGIIDWQEAGCGDWLIDLTRLLYSLHDRWELAAPVLREAERQDPRRIRLYTAYTVLEMVSWPLHRCDRAVSSGSINKARSALHFVETRL
ncbi:MAG: aminoglycoside phosphotransferase family protein [Chloroflexota bacterium]